MTSAQLRVHDLIRFDEDAVRCPLPPWVVRDHGDVWAVVRRQEPTRPEVVAAGVRGLRRGEREAIEVDRSAVLAIVAPEFLVAADASGLDHPGIAGTLRSIRTSAAFRDLAWGPVGSTGFELATGLPAVHVGSDLDIIIRVDAAVTRPEARAMLRALTSPSCRVDGLIETPAGGIALTEWATTSGGEPVLLRTASGPRLTPDPWTTAGRVTS